MKYTFVLFLLFILAVSPFTAEISYQGKISDESNQSLPDDTYDISFIFYDDSLAGNIIWAEVASVQTTDGLFHHNLGSINSINSGLFVKYNGIYLEMRINNQSILPRTKLTSSGFSMTSENLNATDTNGVQSYKTDMEKHSLTIFDSLGDTAILLSPAPHDNSVILPDSAINSDEIYDEPGIASSINIDLTPLPNSNMIDLVKITVEIPDDGYIFLQGKCYLLLSGTTGENTAIVQIDENEGGGSQFPYYQIAGLSGYINTGTNYFPIHVNRTYYKAKGTYTFRLEGRASNPLPAVAKSWDHILTAIYFPTSYWGVEAVAPSSMGDPDAAPIIDNRTGQNETLYKIDYQKIEIINKEK